MSKYGLGALKPKENKTKTYVFTAETLAEHDDRIYRERLPKSAYILKQIITLCYLQALRDKFGFGHDRLGKTYDMMQETFYSVIKGYIKYEDICKMLKDECDIEMIFEMPDGTKITGEEIIRQTQFMPWRVTRK